MDISRGGQMQERLLHNTVVASSAFWRPLFPCLLLPCASPASSFPVPLLPPPSLCLSCLLLPCASPASSFPVPLLPPPSLCLPCLLLPCASPASSFPVPPLPPPSLCLPCLLLPCASSFPMPLLLPLSFVTKLHRQHLY